MAIDKATLKAARKLMIEAHNLILAKVSEHNVNVTGQNVLQSFEISHEMLVSVSSDAMQLTQLSIFAQPESQL
jgi:hypothetical protein